MHTLIHRRAGGCQHPHYSKGVVVVFDNGRAAGAVGQHDIVTEPVTETLGHGTAQYHLIRPGKPLAACQRQGPVPPIAVVGQITVVGGHHRKATMGIPQGDGNPPFHIRMIRQMLHGLPANPGGGIAEPEHAVQQDIHGTAAGTDDQIDTGHGAGKVGAHLVTQTLDAHDHHQTQRDGHNNQCCRGFPGTQRGKNDPRQHGALPRSVRKTPRCDGNGLPPDCHG